MVIYFEEKIKFIGSVLSNGSFWVVAAVVAVAAVIVTVAIIRKKKK